MKAKAVDYLIRRAMRTPYFHLDDYMERYWLVPYAYIDPVSFFKRPIAWILQRFGIAIRVHHILRSDDARAFHDHPWWYCTIILRGGYTEVRPRFSSGIYEGDQRRRHDAGSILIRPAESWHRLELPRGETAWTLFITGPRRNRWGFLIQPRFKQYYRDYNKEHGNATGG